MTDSENTYIPGSYITVSTAKHEIGEADNFLKNDTSLFLLTVTTGTPLS